MILIYLSIRSSNNKRCNHLGEEAAEAIAKVPLALVVCVHRCDDGGRKEDSQTYGGILQAARNAATNPLPPL